MKKNTDVTGAVECLPDHLITDAIVEAAIKEGKIKLLDHLPEKYMTPENVLSVIENTNKERHHDWEAFDLSRIPASARTEQVCRIAVESNAENVRHVPSVLLNTKMLGILIESAEKRLKLMSLFPDQAWDTSLVHQGIKAIVASCTSSSYNHRAYYSGGYPYDAERSMLLVQVFLSCVPKCLKTGKFYTGLFTHTKLSADDIMFLTPEKHKQKAFYLALAKKDFTLVPESCYSYEHFLLALGADSKMNIKSFDENSETLKRIFQLMDDRMADLIIDKTPDFFPRLPKKFRTVKRIVKALENSSGYNYWYRWVKEEDRFLLTPTVCRIFVRKHYDLPECVPASIWNEEFVEYCMEHGTPHYWLERMPKELMSQKLADYLIGYSCHHISAIPKEFITYEHAVKVHRESLNKHRPEEMQKYIPAQFYHDFTHETGLPKEFFGGEVSLHDLREKKEPHTYCKLGQSYLGVYLSTDWRDKALHVTLTRRSSGSIYPKPIFDRAVQTFHTTWLEKLIADNDPQYQKPTVVKDLKGLLINLYYTLVEECDYKGFQVFRNVLLGGTANYVVNLKGSAVSAQSLDEMKKAIDECLAA